MTRLVKIYTHQRGWWETNASYIPYAHETPHRVGLFEKEQMEINELMSHGHSIYDVNDKDYHKLKKLYESITEKFNAVKSHIDETYSRLFEYRGATFQISGSGLLDHKFIATDADGFVFLYKELPIICEYDCRYKKEESSKFYIHDMLDGNIGYYPSWKESIEEISQLKLIGMDYGFMVEFMSGEINYYSCINCPDLMSAQFMLSQKINLSVVNRFSSVGCVDKDSISSVFNYLTFSKEMS